MHEPPFLADRAMIDHVRTLRTAFGADAAREAAARAEDSRDKGNIGSFCRWREVQRMVEALGAERAAGTIH